MTAIEAALTAAWTGADPGPTILENWPPTRRRYPPTPTHPLPRYAPTTGPPAHPETTGHIRDAKAADHKTTSPSPASLAIEAEMTGHLEDDQAAKLEMTGHLAEGQPPKLEMTGRLVDGRPPELEVTGRVAGDQAAEPETAGHFGGGWATEPEMTGHFAGGQAAQLEMTGRFPGERPAALGQAGRFVDEQEAELEATGRFPGEQLAELEMTGHFQAGQAGAIETTGHIRHPQMRAPKTADHGRAEQLREFETTGHLRGEQVSERETTGHLHEAGVHRSKTTGHIRDGQLHRHQEAGPLAQPDLTALGVLLDLSLAGDPARKVGGVRLRRVPSAGGRYPVNAHLGSAYYDPIAHELHGPPAATITLALQPQRTTWRYGPRSLPVLLLDLGHALAAILAAARTLAIPATAAFAPQPPRHGEYPLATVHLGLSTRDKVGEPAEPLPDPPGLPLIEAALTELSTHPPVPLPWDPPLVTPETLLARHTAPWPSRGPISLPDHGLIEVRPTPDLVAGACGQPELARAERLLLATGDPEPLNFVRAGMDVHRAWLLATAAGLSVRPVGCWIRARHNGQRVLHALAVGP